MAKKKRTAPKFTEPETIQMLGLVDAFQRVEKHQSNRNFCFILGAGASVSSGIKSASGMVQDWIEWIYRKKTGRRNPAPTGWATAKRLGIKKFDPNDLAASYSDLYRKMFQHRADEGFAYLEKEMEGVQPSYGYSVLGRILDTTRHKVVITVNFDNLVANAVSLFSETYPMVCGHELLAPFVSDKLRRPLVLKVHRDLLFNPKSQRQELKNLDKGLDSAIKLLLKNYIPIVIGYGGNDETLMKCLENLKKDATPGGIYWCYREGSPPPPERIRRIVAKQHGALVSIMGFDQLMMQFGNLLELNVPEQIIKDRAEKLANRFIDQALELQKDIKKKEEELSKDTGTEEDEAKKIASKDEIDAITDAISRTIRRTVGEKRWWQWESEASDATDPNKMEEIYKAAINALPKSVELLNNYAVFLTYIRQDHDAAEAMYKRAIEADPKRANNLGNYATFLTDIRQDHDAAEAMYKQAIDADPKHANNLGNYANFITEIRKDHDASEAMYRRAIEADPKHVNSLGNYATFLWNVRNNPDAAEEMYKRAIEADPKHANNLGNYANFLKNIRKDPDAAEAMYKRAIEADPKDANNLGNYALFLKNIRKDFDAAEAIFKRASEADPKHANNLGNYANFLTDIRKDHDAAEAMYKRAIDADPKHANNLGNYARLLLSAGQLDEGLQRLDQAIANLDAADPRQIHVECWMYAYCCRPGETQAEALGNLKKLMLTTEIRTEDWDFSGVIAQAKKMNHPESAWLDKLAEVLAGRAKPETLDTWEAWKNAKLPEEAKG